MKARWEFSQTDLKRIWTLCTLLFVAAALYALTTGESAKALAGLTQRNTSGARADALNKSARSALLFFQWMPIALFPIAAAQVFSQRDKFDLTTFSWWLRRRRKTHPGRGPEAINVGYPYFAVCMVAAGAAKARSPWFFVGMCVLLAWALWVVRPRTYSLATWIASLGTAMALGFVMQLGITYTQALLQRLDSAIIARIWGAKEFDSKESRTRIGALGPLKLSGRIVMRVKSGDQPPPSLLREASYSFFKTPIWASTNRDFTPLDFETTNESTWILLTNPAPLRMVTTACFLDGGKGVLALPLGAARLEDLPVFTLERNRLGVVRSAAGPGFVEYRALYREGMSIDAPPAPDDLEIPLAERPALAQIAGELDLTNKTPDQVLAAVGAFFKGQCEYSLRLDEGGHQEINSTPLGRFLLHHRKGHCEYFGTATALLLRQAGIPTRYAVGYSVQERKGGEWIIRERHAHAWCLAWANGAWHDIDNTPGSWVQAEAEHASLWEPLSDLWSKAWFAFSKFRWGQTEIRKYLIWIVVPPLVIVVARLAFSKQWRRAREEARAKAAARALLAGLDSEFFLIEKRLAELGLERRTSETLAAWLARVRAAGMPAVASLEPALTLHYQLRFDPKGVSAEERALLREKVQAWLGQAESAVNTREG